MPTPEYHKLAHEAHIRKEHYVDLIRQYYDLVTPIYLEKWGVSFHFAIFRGEESLDDAMVATEQWLADFAGLHSGMKVLDVGCGVGGPALTIARHCGAHITGINIVEAHVQIARARASEMGFSERTEFLVADAMAMPFPDSTFDAVYVIEAGCHMPDKGRFYKECARVLKPGGIFVGTDWFRSDTLLPQDEADYIEPICRLHGIPNLISLADLRGFLNDAGFAIHTADNLAKYGNVLKNWEHIDRKSLRLLNTYMRFVIPKVEQMMLEGGLKLIDAARRGVFLLGIWKAVRQT
ncbi:MAG: methyltransferase domain-containing protein [Gemmataceae bacterium]|nr:methyltransferase domain-containing protein [Gemmata sp.]MDW8196468.1 methyltransferase domain-containing protein [Gemmataceae bacterium]